MALQLHTVPDPVGLEWQDWADTVVGFNPSLQTTVDPDSGWREFAQQLALVVAGTPEPNLFELWEDWAVSLKQMLQV